MGYVFNFFILSVLLITKYFFRFKIYISLKLFPQSLHNCYCFVEFKIYISLKRLVLTLFECLCFVEFKIYISLKPQIEIFDSNFAFYKLIFNCIQKNGSTPIQPKGNIDKSLFELECKF